MLKKLFVAGLSLSFVSLLVVGCGVPQQEYDELLAERNTFKSELGTVQETLEDTQDELNATKGDLKFAENGLLVLEDEIETLEDKTSVLENELINAQNQNASLNSNLNEVNDSLAEARSYITKMESAFAVLLFYNDFEDGKATGLDFFNFTDEWSVIQEDDNSILQGEGHIHADVIGSYEWVDYTIEGRINLVEGSGFYMNVRAIPDLSQRYMVAIFKTEIQIIKSPGGQMVAQEFFNKLRGWKDLQLIVDGDNIRVYINGVLKIDYTDNEPLQSGGINIEVSGDSRVYLDNIVITVPK